MDGVCRAVGAPVPVKWAGRMRILHPLRLVDFGTIEHYILLNRSSPLRAAQRKVATMSLDVAKMVLDEAAKMERDLPHYITPDEVADFIETPIGFSLAWWLMLRRDDPDITFEEISEEAFKLTDAELLKFQDHIAAVSGFSIFAERDWVPEGVEFDHEGDDVSQRKRFKWKYAIRQLAEAYLGVTPETCGEMTMFTFRMLYCDAKNVKGYRMSVEQWREMERKKREREAKDAAST